MTSSGACAGTSAGTSSENSAGASSGTQDIHTYKIQCHITMLSKYYILCIYMYSSPMDKK